MGLRRPVKNRNHKPAGAAAALSSPAVLKQKPVFTGRCDEVAEEPNETNSFLLLAYVVLFLSSGKAANRYRQCLPEHIARNER